MRIVTHTENSQNRGSAKNASSKFIGVSYKKATNKWTACIRVNSKLIHLGNFINENDAAKIRDIATKKYFGEFGKLNFTHTVE